MGLYGLLNEQQYNAQFAPGRGATNRYGPRPPTPDEVAPRGTKEWRDAFNRQDEWRRFQMHSGATAYDLGLRDEKELGKHFFTRIRMGEFDPRARGNWIQANQNAARGFYRPNDTNFYGMGGGGFAGGGGGGGMVNVPAPFRGPIPSPSPAGPPTGPVTGTSTNFEIPSPMGGGASGAGIGSLPINKRRRGLRGLLGG